MIINYLTHGAPYIDQDSDKLIYTHDPAQLGYFGIYFESIDQLDSRIFSDDLNQYIPNGNHDVRNPKIVSDCLIAYCAGIDIPEVSIKTLTQSTVMYLNIHVPTILDYAGQNITVRFYDTSTGVLFRFFRNWLYALRPPDKDKPLKTTRTGLLKCNAIAFCTDPTLTDITFACGFLGLMPTTLPTNAYTLDTTNRSFVIMNQQFRFDRIVFDDHIFNYVQNTILPNFINHDGVIQWQLG